jgi:hypothetical protein
MVGLQHRRLEGATLPSNHGKQPRRTFMTHRLLPLALLAAAFSLQATAGMAQDITVPGGATGANVFCIQAGDLTSGAFVGTFLQTGTGAWEERLKAGTFKLDEKKRDDLTVELYDNTRSASVQFDFVNKTIKYKPANPRENWRDRYYILNATDKPASTDCASLASLGGASNQAGGGGGSKGGQGGGSGRAPSNPVQMMTVPPKTVLVIPPGTEFTALAGPPCPNQPGFFLCPNKFTCAPIGGVCCPVGSCNAGTFCDFFIGGNCIVPGDPRFCPGTGNNLTGFSLHCDVGLTCVANNLCQ